MHISVAGCVLDHKHLDVIMKTMKPYISLMHLNNFTVHWKPVSWGCIDDTPQLICICINNKVDRAMGQDWKYKKLNCMRFIMIFSPPLLG